MIVLSNLHSPAEMVYHKLEIADLLVGPQELVDLAAETEILAAVLIAEAVQDLVVAIEDLHLADLAKDQLHANAVMTIIAVILLEMTQEEILLLEILKDQVQVSEIAETALLEAKEAKDLHLSAIEDLHRAIAIVKHLATENLSVADHREIANLLVIEDHQAVAVDLLNRKNLGRIRLKSS